MRAKDVMVRDVVSAHPDTDIADAVKLLVSNDISALPVIEQDGKLVGILSEADLMRRVEIGTLPQRPRWLESLVGASTLAEEFARAQGKRVAELMTTNVVSVSEDTSLAEIAGLFERNSIKRVPVVRDGRLVGIVSRSNLIQALAAAISEPPEPDDADHRIREQLLERLREQQWTDFGSRNVIVRHGVVHLWGLVGSKEEHRALLALAEGVPGVARVSDETIAAY